ncbi:hypothetical protein Daesc_008464 [Daldinia eschscholtzii]|uniref:Fungal-type protein kinase domain-containing protein n=1 Tax=Daldinia eschscholtzii TaxID=292717 RepID=A0AAX6MBS1_9PEZI
MINEDDDDNPSWSSFLIDLDLSIRTTRDSASGAQGKTGTRAFMAIGALLGEQHSFIHDLESFFWVLFWICVHYDGPERSRVIPEFEQWNYMRMDLLASVKMGTIADEEIFMKSVETFTAYYQPFIPLINRLREVVFPGGKRYKREDKKLSFQMREILKEACNDPGI